MKSLCLWLVLLCGCANYDPASNPVHSVGLTAGGNAQTQDWSAGITITFKTTPPAFVVADLTASGAIQPKANGNIASAARTWILPQADKLNATHQRAIANALTVPGTVISRSP